MIQKLHIQNYAIIDALTIEFSGGMNVITGETGAGKSILMGALSLILGDRADSAVLMEKDKKCFVEGVFTLAKNSAEAWTVGELLYWDDTNKVVTATSTGHKLIGVAYAVAANPSSTGQVRLNAAFIS